MPLDRNKFACNLYAELRKEIVSTQRIRTQIIGFKITFVSAAIALIFGPLRVQSDLLIYVALIPPIAAIFFDDLIIQNSISIKRIGKYCEVYLESIMETDPQWPVEFPLWEGFMKSSVIGTKLPLYGNAGLTILASIISILYLFLNRPPRDVITYLIPSEEALIPIIFAIFILIIAIGIHVYNSRKMDEIDNITENELKIKSIVEMLKKPDIDKKTSGDLKSILKSLKKN